MVEGRDKRPQPRMPKAETCAGPGLNLTECPLGWLARRKDKDGRAMIAAAEFDAGERLRAGFWFARMTPRVTANWS